MSGLVGYLLLFLVIPIGFVFIHLLIGKLVRPNRPDPEKLTIYECGEPTIGSAWVQFDLRFYVVALLFVIFDVEVAFFFPWAVVFGQANALAKPDAATPGQLALADAELMQGKGAWAAQRAQTLAEREGLDEAATTDAIDRAFRETREKAREPARRYAWLAFGDILVFFSVLLVGFAYFWARGDLKWVRALGERGASAP